MQRQTYIERIRRIIYGSQPSDDAQITIGLVNNILNDAIAAAAAANYNDSVKIQGVESVANSFYTTYSGIAVTAEGNFIFKFELPDIPVGLGTNLGVASVRFSDGKLLSFDAIPLSINQVAYTRGRRQIPNKIPYWTEGKYGYVESPQYNLTNTTAVVRMISGGDSTDLTSQINVPPDYFPIMDDYIIKKLAIHQAQPQDTQNDGVDNK